ncbi:phosphatase PAP2 family protein [Paenibacillus sp. CMAA1364]
MIVKFDNGISTVIQGFESSVLTLIMGLFSFIGAWLPVGIISLATIFVLYSVLKFRMELVFFTLVMMGSLCLNVLLKLVFQRERPNLRVIAEASGYSFPSGHTMAAFTLYGLICFLLWKHTTSARGRVILLLFVSMMIAGIGISRIYLGVHYPSDVLGALFASGTWLAISIGIYQRILEKRAPKVC